MWNEAGLNISYKMGPGEGQLRDLAPSRRGLLRADSLGPLTSRYVGRGGSRGTQSAPSRRVESRQCSWQRGPAADSVATSDLRQLPLHTEVSRYTEKGIQGANFMSVKNAY